ncbi:hypothetical protein [Neoroseomonas soli]|uniref:Uncharacterized protein n=1 Tax=Neoroseomonas soli TaxID=1081025 RepID=A0A9X9WY88_9PROT|nr:hypothetical protein [Neoroseomonas soli]MBR0672117.1 hypothetical protein [Neoroseomonas soli]
MPRGGQSFHGFRTGALAVTVMTDGAKIRSDMAAAGVSTAPLPAKR